MVHQYQLNGYNIVLDTCSGSVHAVSEPAYDMIALYQDHTPEEIIAVIQQKYGDEVSREDIEECLDDIAALKREGKLFTEDTFEPLADTFKERSGDVVKALSLKVTYVTYLIAIGGVFVGTGSEGVYRIVTAYLTVGKCPDYSHIGVIKRGMSLFGGGKRQRSILSFSVFGGDYRIIYVLYVKYYV